MNLILLRIFVETTNIRSILIVHYILVNGDLVGPNSPDNNFEMMGS